MNAHLSRLLLGLHALLLRLYPSSFRAAFSQEMQETFADAVADASQVGLLPLVILSLREIGDWPFRVLQEHWLQIRPRRQEAPMQTANGVAADVENRNTALHGMPWAWGETWPVLLLFLGFAVTSIMITYLSQVVAKTPGGSLLATILAVLAWLVLPLAGFAVAAWKGFPRWSYPYTGYLLGAGCIAAALLTSSVFGGLVVLLAATLLALTVPTLRRALHSAWQDWTLLSLAIYGILPFLVPIAFDDSHPNDITGYLALAVLVATAGAWLYTRGQRAWEKLLALWLGGMLCLLMALLDVAYFNRGLGASSPPTGGWIINLMQNFTLLLLASGLIGVLQRSLRLLRSAG